MGCCYTTGPNEVMVKSGCGVGKPEMVAGGMVCLWPIGQKIQKLSLNTMTLTIDSTQVYMWNINNKSVFKYFLFVNIFIIKIKINV